MLKVLNLVKIFDQGTVNEKIAIQNVSLTVEKNDFITVIGGNGAGKSTLLNAIAGVFPVDSGSISINNIDVTKLTEHKRAAYIGRVFQDPRMGTASNMTIEENLAMAYRRGNRRGLNWGISNKERDLFAHRLKELGLGLEGRLKYKAGNLSGGQRQALTLVMATFHNPDILLLDEHTAALDPKTAKKVLEVTIKLVEENKLTALMVTHNMKDALRVGNRIAMMHEGKCILDIAEPRKKDLTVTDLLGMFEQVSGEDMVNDRMLLNH
ncbi:MAG: ABC transporter ATP-binding protein [Clostridiales bacterium]|jgi:putative ABC transport system ATP-binding protein|nr:ABC transporter ATP-binding protein [Clostridiales bacterium]